MATAVLWATSITSLGGHCATFCYEDARACDEREKNYLRAPARFQGEQRRPASVRHQPSSVRSTFLFFNKSSLGQMKPAAKRPDEKKHSAPVIVPDVKIKGGYLQ
jgi:hypothetical protein